MGAIPRNSYKSGVYFSLAVMSWRTQNAVKSLFHRKGWDPTSPDGVLSFLAYDSVWLWKRKPKTSPEMPT